MKEFKFLLVLVVSLLVMAVYAGRVFGPSLPPAEVRVTNITDSSLSVSWITGQPAPGGMVVSTQANRLLRVAEFFACDYFLFRCHLIPDQISGQTKTHYLFLKDLKPNSAYYYRIYSGNRLWKVDQEGKILPSLKTKATPDSLPLPNPVFSSVYLADGKTPVANALVYVSLVSGQNRNLDRSTAVSTVTDEKGLWLLNLEVSPRASDLLLIEVYAPDGQKMAEFAELPAGLPAPAGSKTVKSILLK